MRRDRAPLGAAFAGAILSLSFVSSVSASDWPRFRGPNGTGVSPDRGLPSEIGPDTNVSWRVETPRGHSSPIVVGGRLMLTGHDGDERITLCLDAATGEQIWRRSLWTTRPGPAA